MTFQPLCDVTAYKPVVTKNTGTYAAPTWVVLTETVDYVIDYKTGFITLTSPLPEALDPDGERTVTMRVVANHMKINLAQFMQFFNEST